MCDYLSRFLQKVISKPVLRSKKHIKNILKLKSIQEYYLLKFFCEMLQFGFSFQF